MSDATTQHTPADVREQAAADADEIWYHWIEGQEDLAIAALRKASDEELARFLGMVADWQRCPKPSDHDAIAALRSEAQGEADDFNPLTDLLPEHEAERVERVLSRAARRGDGGA